MKQNWVMPGAIVFSVILHVALMVAYYGPPEQYDLISPVPDVLYNARVYFPEQPGDAPLAPPVQRSTRPPSAAGPTAAPDPAPR